MFTNDQAQFLADFADKGLAEQAEIAERNVQVEATMAVQARRAEKIVELEAQAQALIADGMKEFEATATTLETLD